MTAEKMAEFIVNLTEKIPADTEKIAPNTEKIETQIEKIPEIMTEKIRSRGQRRSDKARRNYNQTSLLNLKQYRNKAPVKTGSNNWIWILVGIAIAIAVGIILWKIYEWWKEKQDKKE